ncbi:MAG: YfhO family protein [Xanthomonadales bacterium]|nr:YfhO family protein [Xanthomonadales bacterium]
MTVAEQTTSISKADLSKAVVVYLLMVLCFCYPVLQGKLIAQTDYLNFIPPWDSVKSEQLEKPGNPYLQDQSNEFLPFFTEAKRQFSQGIFPLWNPYIFAGNPLWANTQSALMFPLNWFHYVLPPPAGFTISVLFKLFLSSFLTYLFVRKIKVEHVPALFAGAAFGFSAFSVFWLNHPHTNVVCLIPLCFYATERLLDYKNKSVFYWYAMLVALTLFAGHVEIAFLTATACGLYYLIRLLQEGHFALDKILRFLFVYVFALFLAAVLIFPFVEFLFNTAIWAERSATKQLHIPPPGLLSIFLGDLFILDGWPKNQIGFHAFSPYVGMLTVFFALMAVWKRGRFVWVFMLLSLLSLAVAFGVNPLFFLVKNTPLFSHLPLFYFSILAAFSLSVLAAFGMRICLQKMFKLKNKLMVVLIVMISLGLLHSFWMPNELEPFLEDKNLLLESVRFELILAMLAMMVLIVLLCFSAKYPHFIGYIFVIWVFADLWSKGHTWNPAIDFENAYPREMPESIEFLHEQKKPFRTVGYDQILIPSTNLLVQIHDIRGYDVPVINRYHQFFNQVLKGNNLFWYYYFAKFDVNILPYLDILNVKYILSKKDLSTKIPPHLEQVYDHEIKIYQNHNAKGLAYFVDEVIWVESAEDALEKTQEVKHKLGHTVVLEKQKGMTKDAMDEHLAKKTPSIEFHSTEANHIQIYANTEKPAWMVLSQSYYPGWVARVDGVKTNIFAANYVLQAIKIPAGSHQVSFKYQPLSFTLGWLVSVCSFIFALWKITRKTK